MGDSPNDEGALLSSLHGITYTNNYLESTVNSTDPEIVPSVQKPFLRALHYSYLMDLFGNVPLVLNVSKESAPRVSRKHLFDFINGELREVCGETANCPRGFKSDAKVVNGKQDGYGHANKAAALFALICDYINAKVYSGTEHNDSAKYFAQKVIDTPYNLCKTPTAVTQVSRNSLWQIMM